MNVEVFQKARELGEIMQHSDEIKALRQAEDALAQDEQAQAMIKQFNEMEQTMQEVMQSPNPDQAAIHSMTHTMQHLQSELVNMPVVKAYNEANTGFSKLLQSVNQVISFMLTGQVSPLNGGGCSPSDCASCGGDCHIH